MLIKARRGAVYVDPCAMDMVFTEASPNPPVVGLWQAQLNLWVTSDIIAAINATNEEAFAKARWAGPAADVLTAAVKRLARIDINENYVLPNVEAPVGARPLNPLRRGAGDGRPTLPDRAPARACGTGLGVDRTGSCQRVRCPALYLHGGHGQPVPARRWSGNC